MQKKRPTVADVLSQKGKYQYTMMRVEDWDELAAAEAAGIDMCSVPPELLCSKEFRTVAPSIFAVPGMPLYSAPANDDAYLAWAYKMMEAGAVAVYCAAGFKTVKKMAKQYIPVIGHVGLVPHYCTWTGGFKAVGRSAEQAKEIYDRVKRYEDVGAFGVEIEVVPEEMTAEISKRTSLFMVSMGGGKGGDCQYLFACDVLGTNRGHVPRHSKQYANLALEYDRIQEMRIAAFKEWVGEVQSGVWPDAPNVIHIDPAEATKLVKMIGE